MSQGPLHDVVRHLRWIARDVAPETTDRQLLERFRASRDETAFAALVERHGPLVWGVCRRVLRHHQDAEDTFQATFLVLARKAGAVCWRDSVHGWLYEVASRLAGEARVRAARRRLHEGRAAAQAQTETLPDDAARELGALLDEELHRLPEWLRAPLLLCYLEGRTSDQAARHLGWSLRTLQRRLTQGRELLRARLTRRGITLSAVLLAPGLARSAALPAPLAATTVQAAIAFTTGAGLVPARAAALAQGMFRGMVMTRVRFAAALLFVLGTVTGAGVLARHSTAGAATADPALPASRDAGAPRENARTIPAFAHRLWVIVDLVEEKHPEPPSRDALMLAAAEALVRASKVAPPDDLRRRVAGLKTPEQLAAFLKEIWPQGKEAPPAEQLGAAITQGLFAAIPGGGSCMPPEMMKLHEASSANRYVGIGIQVRIHPGENLPQIVTPVGKGPARRAGIEPNDLIVAVDGKSTRDVPLRQVVEWLRGEEGTTFLLTLRAPGAAQSRTLTMTRTVVPFDTVFGYRRAPDDGWQFRMEPRGPLGYVRLETLLSSTPHELRQVERRLRSEGTRAVVFDLRSSSGISEFHNGMLVASSLLDGGLMWSLRGADKQARECRAGHECLFRDWPLAVLVNDRVDPTLAAIAAALQDNGRATLIGETTREGGYVTSVLPLADGEGGLTLRTGRLERAAPGRGWPVQPDLAVPLTREQRQAVDEWLQAKDRTEQPGSRADRPPADPQLDRAVELLHAALRGPKPSESPGLSRRG
jgi:C-terminal peptidase prc